MLVCFGFPACTINVNPDANANIARITPPELVIQSPTPVDQTGQTRWTVAVCTSRARSVTLQAGPSKEDTQTFATWTEGGQKIYALPERVQNLTEIYFHAVGSEPKPVELCVLFDGRPKQRVAFEEGGEGSFISAGDDDGNDCRCVN